MTIDWSTLMSDLKTAGWRTADVARELNLPWSTVDRWSNGSKPCGDAAVNLYHLHEKICNKSA